MIRLDLLVLWYFGFFTSIVDRWKFTTIFYSAVHFADWHITNPTYRLLMHFKNSNHWFCEQHDISRMLPVTKVKNPICGKK